MEHDDDRQKYYLAAVLSQSRPLPPSIVYVAPLPGGRKMHRPSYTTYYRLPAPLIHSDICKASQVATVENY